MKRDRLESLLDKTIKEIKHNRTMVENIKHGMQENYAMLRGETQKIFMGETSLEDLDTTTLIRLTIEVYNNTHTFNLNPYGHFTDKEIEKAKVVEQTTDTHVHNFPIEVHNVIKVSDHTYVTFVNIKTLVGLYNSNLLEYNYEINKKYKLVKNKEGKLVPTIDINLREVKEIAEKIVNNTYSIDKVILNVLRGSGIHAKEVAYNEEERLLIIFKSQIDIIDGLHDISALSYVVEQHPKIELKVEVEINHCNLEDIKKYFNKLNIKGGVN